MKNPKLKKHRLGIFKIKDSISKNTIQIGLQPILKSMPLAKYIWVTKVPGVNNKVIIDVHYEDLPKKNDKIQFEKNKM